MTAPILQQLLVLYFAIIYSWQLSSSGITLVGLKNSSIYPYISRILQTFFFSFSLTNACLLSRLRKAYTVLWAADLLPQKQLNTILLTSFENLKHFAKNTRFLGFDGPSNYFYIYLRTTDRHFLDQGNIRHPTSKLLKCDLVQTLITFRNPSLRSFCCWEEISCLFGRQDSRAQASKETWWFWGDKLK